MDTQLILMMGGGVAIVLLLVGVVVSIRDDRTISDRMGRYTEEKDIPKDKSAVVSDWINTQTVRYSWGENLAKELARADIKLKVGEYIILTFISIFLIATILYILSGHSLIFILVGGALGFYLPRFYVNLQKGKRLIRFSEQLSDMLNLTVNGLRAGYSSMQAMEAVSRELPAPICDEFRRVVQEVQLGVSMEQALDNLLRRIPSSDLDLVVTAMNVQREVGGNLAEILDTISHTIRERVRIKGEIRVLTSQVVYSGRFLSLLPAIILGAISLMNKNYFSQYFNPETKLIGMIALGTAAGLVISGYFVMTKLANIEV